MAFYFPRLRGTLQALFGVGKGTLDFTALTAARAFTFPDAGGTFGTAAFTATGAYATASQGVNSITVNSSGVIHVTPATFVNTGGAWALSHALLSQAANTVFGNFTGGSATPTFAAAPTFSGANLTALNASAVTAGTLPIANGGTGQATARAARDALGLLTIATLATTGTVTVDVGTSARFLLAPTGAVTVALANDANSVSWVVFVRASAFAVTWPTGVKWVGGVAPTLPTVAGHVMMVAFTRLAAGEYVGTASGEAY